MIGKRLKKIIQQLLLIFCILKKKKYVQLIFQKLICKEGWHYLAVKMLLALLRGITSKHNGDFIA